jgi:hypothetical protein
MLGDEGGPSDCDLVVCWMVNKTRENQKKKKKKKMTNKNKVSAQQRRGHHDVSADDTKDENAEISKPSSSLSSKNLTSRAVVPSWIIVIGLMGSLIAMGLSGIMLLSDQHLDRYLGQSFAPIIKSWRKDNFNNVKDASELSPQDKNVESVKLDLAAARKMGHKLGRQVSGNVSVPEGAWWDLKCESEYNTPIEGKAYSSWPKMKVSLSRSHGSNQAAHLPAIADGL